MVSLKFPVSNATAKCLLFFSFNQDRLWQETGSTFNVMAEITTVTRNVFLRAMTDEKSVSSTNAFLLKISSFLKDCTGKQLCFY